MKIIVTRAFSLIELMVVIAIVAVLSAVAVPAYKDYILRSKVAGALTIVDSYLTKITDYRNKNGTFPTTIAAACGGSAAVAPLVNGTCGSISYPNIQDIRYYYDNSYPNSAMIYIWMDPAVFNLPGGTYNELHFVLKEVNGTIARKCGKWTATSNTYNLPDKWMPAVCSETSLITYYTS